MMKRSAGFVAVLTAGIALSALAGGCTPLRESHGWVSDTGSQSEVQPGVDTKSTVMARMGSPSSTGSFGGNDWYYVTALQQSYAYFKPKTTARTITVVRFSQDDVVQTVDKFGVEKGRIVDYATQKTPTRGRELGVLEQIFGTVGTRLPTDQAEENQRNRR
jgi:outer membrane protein assembly factor BamE (lipoprotein component of BamABCDE complex)